MSFSQHPDPVKRERKPYRQPRLRETIGASFAPLGMFKKEAYFLRRAAIVSSASRVSAGR
jgi:hypothetical protein